MRDEFIRLCVPAKQSLSTIIIKMETNYHLLLIVVVNGRFFHFDFPVSPEPRLFPSSSSLAFVISTSQE